MIQSVKLLIKRIAWRRMNRHNFSRLNSLFPLTHVKVGRGTYGNLNIVCYNPELYILIGNYCSIGDEVTFMMGGRHNYSCISTYPFYSKVYKKELGEGIDAQPCRQDDIVIEDDVWIGYGALVFPGVTIGKGAVIGARSIVTHNIPAYSIYAGTKIIKKRFSEEIISKIQKIDFVEIQHRGGDKYSMFCRTEINDENIDRIMEAFQERHL